MAMLASGCAVMADAAFPIDSRTLKRVRCRRPLSSRFVVLTLLLFLIRGGDVETHPVFV
jgi:hypothetical protein